MMRKMNMKKAAGFILAAAMLMAAGCSGADSGNTTTAAAGSAAGGETVSETASEAAQPDSGSTQSEETQAGKETAGALSGGSVTICHPTPPATCFLPFSASTGDRFAVAPAIESLGRIDSEGNVYGWLAESFSVDPDQLTVTIKLKEGIKFSDGSDFNAEAVIWNFDKMAEGGKASEIGSPAAYEKTDDYTVLLSYESWANDWEKVLSEVYIYCPAAFEQNGEDWAAINPVGTGPFVMTEYVKGDHVNYQKNENYWLEGKPHLDELSIVFMSDITTQQAAFMNGEVDLLTATDATLVQTLSAAGFEDIAKQAPDLAGIRYIMFASGDGNSPFHELKVRQAVSHAIDWEGYVYSLTGNKGITLTQFGVPGAWSYDDSVALPEFNTDKAKALLAEAGYADGFDTTITTIASNNDIAVLMQASLAQIGIKAEIKVLDNSDFNAKKKESTYDGGIITGQGSSKMDFTNNYIRLYSSQGLNYLNMMQHPDDYEEALFGAREAKDLDEKKALLKTASKKLVSEYCLILPVAGTFSTCFTSDRVADSGIYQITADIWTPEDIKVIK